jgi:hypothetical protein
MRARRPSAIAGKADIPRNDFMSARSRRATSASGTKQTLMPTMSMSAFGGKADFLIYAVVSATDPKRTVDLAAAYEAPTAKYV